MKNIELNIDNSLINSVKIKECDELILAEIADLKKALNAGYESDRASINAIFDTDNLNNILKIASNYKQLDTLIIIGIGGSNLGTWAVQEAVLGKLHNYITGPRVFYADTTDAAYIERLAEIIESDLRAKKKVLIIGLSKSGGTTETIANFEYLVEHSLRHGADLASSVVVISDKGSRFGDFAKEQGFQYLEIEPQIGGRFSVFSAVGIFPLLLLGIDVGQLVDGAKLSLERCLNEDLSNNIAARSAAVIYCSHNGGINIHDTFFFANDLESLGKWYRQLTGESVGKERDLNEKKVNTGITPTVSIGSTDLHSMAQLYLGGPKDKLTTFVTVQKSSDISLPNNQSYQKLVENIQGQSLHSIMGAIESGTLIAFKKAKNPYMHLTLPYLTPGSIGQFLQFKMIEIMMVARLMNVNAFDQPAVEKYKIETRRLLDEK